jgi:hypothetical protein
MKQIQSTFPNSQIHDSAVNYYLKKNNNGERSQSQTYSPVTVNRHLYSQPSDRLWYVRIELMAEPSR